MSRKPGGSGLPSCTKRNSVAGIVRTWSPPLRMRNRSAPPRRGLNLLLRTLAEPYVPQKRAELEIRFPSEASLRDSVSGIFSTVIPHR